MSDERELMKCHRIMTFETVELNTWYNYICSEEEGPQIIPSKEPKQKHLIYAKVLRRESSLNYVSTAQLACLSSRVERSSHHHGVGSFIFGAGRAAQTHNLWSFAVVIIRMQGWWCFGWCLCINWGIMEVMARLYCIFLWCDVPGKGGPLTCRDGFW